MIEVGAVALFVATVVTWGRVGAPILAHDWVCLARDLDPSWASTQARLFTRVAPGDP